MGKRQAISAEVDDETLADMKRLAEHMKCSVEHLAATAILRFVGDKIGAVAADEFAHLTPYKDLSPTGRRLSEAEHKARVAMRAFLQVGEDAVKRGKVFSQEEMECWFAERVAARSQAAAE